jgi:hypothetical protein
MPTCIAEPLKLCCRSQARTCERPATETLIVIAVRRTGSTILLARLCHQGTNLPGRCDERTVMVMRLVARHLGDQDFEVVGHTLPRKLHGMRRRDERSGWPRILI